MYEEESEEHNPMNPAIGVLVPISGIILAGYVVLLAMRRSQAQSHARADLQKHLLDKFASGGEFAAFLESPGGKRFLENISSPQVNAKERILKTMRGGVVLTVVGLGALALSVRNHALIIPGALVLALGVGLLIATAVSYRFSKKLGLLERTTPGTNE